MADRQDIARRHGIPHLAHKLIGDGAEELDADAQAKAGVIRALSPLDLDKEPVEPPEPPIEGLPPRDKPVSDWTDEEAAASLASFERTMREGLRREQREQREERARLEAHANRTPEQQFADSASDSLQPGVKGRANRALIERLHPDDER